MKDVASYSNEGVTFDNMDKVNIIFGSNGTGKTTISSFMKEYSGSQETGNPIADRFAQCGVTWEDARRQKILVYNRQFKKENIGNTSMPGVFIMGKDAVDTAKDVEKLEQELAQKKKTTEEMNAMIADKRLSVLPGGSIYNAYYVNTDTKIYIEAENLYDESLKGLKRDAGRRLEKILDLHKNLKSADVLSEDTIREHISIANMETSDPIPEVTLPDISALTGIEQDPIWTKMIAGSGDLDFAGFINDLNLSDWVKKGMEKLADTNGLCPFCQQHTATDSLIDKLNGYFDESYENDLAKIKTLAKSYETKGHEIIGFIESREIFDMAAKLRDHLERNLHMMQEKINSPSTKLSLNDGISILSEIYDQISKINVKIRSTNDLIARKRSIKAELPKKALQYLVCKYEKEINGYITERDKVLKEADNLDKELVERNAEISRLYQKISDLRAKASDSTAVVERINKTLLKHNFKSFKLVNHDDSSYRIVRKNGEDASGTLSEGEETLLTFLYFIHLLEGSTTRGKDSGYLIAVIDDPISSLDNSVLTFIAREIKELIFRVGQNNSKLKQLIILTHNINFHKSLAKGPVSGGSYKNPMKAFYILEKKLGAENTSVRRLENSDEVETEYNEMWKLLKRAYGMLRNPDAAEEEKIDYKYTIQNTMRRIYETFFSNICGMRDNDIVMLFEHGSKNYSTGDCRNLVEWLNEGSHSVSVNDYSDLPSDEMINNYLKIFEELFLVTGNHGQFTKLMN